MVDFKALHERMRERRAAREFDEDIKFLVAFAIRMLEDDPDPTLTAMVTRVKKGLEARDAGF